MEQLKKWDVDLLIKNITLGGLFFILLTTGCGHSGNDRTIDSSVLDNPATLRDEKNNKMPAITFEEIEYNAGEISQGEVLNYTYKFKNTGNAPLVISSVSASCGCTIAKKYSKGKIFPGEEGEIAVEFDSDNKWGDMNVVITVATNAIPTVTQLFIRTHIVVPDNLKSN